MPHDPQNAFRRIVLLDADRSAPAAFLDVPETAYQQLIDAGIIYSCGGDPGEAEGDAFNTPGVTLRAISTTLHL